MSHYSEEVAKIRAEEKARKRAQAESCKQREIEDSYNKKIAETKELLKNMSIKEVEIFTLKLLKEMLENKEKLERNNNRLEKINKQASTEIPDLLMFIGTSTAIGLVAGATLCQLTSSETPTIRDICKESFIGGALGDVSCGVFALVLNNLGVKLRPISEMKRNKIKKNISRLESKSKALNEIDAYLYETYRIWTHPLEERPQKTKSPISYEIEM